MSGLITRPHSVFVSHDSRDTELARILAKTLERITLGQVSVWFSSDQSPIGGIQPGQLWHNEIIQRLRESRVMIALLTRRSVDRPWITFESGFAAALEQCDLVPVCIGIDISHDLPSPLQAYQTTTLTDYESLKRFASKLLTTYGISFDEEMSEPILRKTISDLVKHSQMEERAPTDALEDLGAKIMRHVDLRLVEMEHRFTAVRHKDPLTDSHEESLSYSIQIDLDFPALSRTEQMLIRPSTTVQDVLDSVYFVLESSIRMPTFQYLNRWILKEQSTGICLVLREVGSMIPATVLFPPSARWIALPLKQPYNPSMSDDTARWYSKRV